MKLPPKSALTAVGATTDHSVVDNIVLRSVRVRLDTELGRAFVEDCARHIEGLLSDSDIKIKWYLSDESWAGLATNGKLLDAVRAKRERRILSGEAAKEAAQRFLLKAPSVLRDILGDENVAPRHRIEAARELHRVAASGDTSDKLEKEKLVVTINLGANEKPLVYEKDIIRPLPFDGDQE
jgi:hypothetical protein